MQLSTSEVAPRKAVPDEYSGESWETLTQQSYQVMGADLEKGDVLVGVPMCLVKATFRPSDIVNAKTGEAGFYVSLDTIIGPEAELLKAARRKRIPEGIAFEAVFPDEHLVFNEGGTGVYRQIVKFLRDTGRIKIKTDLPDEGAYGECGLDISPAKWEVDKSAEFRVDDDGQPTLGFSIRLLCPRGLRASEYENDFTKSGRTRYIA